MKIVIITINIYMIYIYKHNYVHTQSDRKGMRDKQALMGVNSKWRIMYMQMRHIR